MNTPPIITIRAVVENFPELTWTGPCPWPGLPVAHSGDLPYTSLTSFECCQGGEFGALIDSVAVHLPVPGRPVATVGITGTHEIGQHLVDQHDFTPLRCDLAAGVHVEPHRGCILR